MSVFSDNITNSTDLQSFHDYWKKFIEDRFDKIYNDMKGNLHWVSSTYNSMLGDSTIRSIFEKFGIYNPWIHCSHHIREDYSIIQIVIFYSEDSTIYVHNDAKVFLLINIPVPEQS